MGWKVYFWILAILAMPGYFFVGFSRIWEGIDLVVTLFLVAGLFAYAWKRRILNQQFWKVVLIVNIVWDLYYHYLVPPPNTLLEVMPEGMSMSMNATINLMFFIPMFFAVYLYAFKKSSIWKGTSA